MISIWSRGNKYQTFLCQHLSCFENKSTKITENNYRSTKFAENNLCG